MAPKTIATILKEAEIGKRITVKGWVRTKRESKNVLFINVNDGSCVKNIQIVADPKKFNTEKITKITTGAGVAVTGELVESQGAGQSVELLAHEIILYGAADPETYPLQPKKHSLEFLREIAHLRPRTNTFGAVLRVRHALAFAIHKFFNDQGFYYLHTPIITGSDAEGAGEMFRVTTLDAKNPPLKEDGTVDFKEDFFGRETNLTVSGQLEGETGALALGKIYTFGPTFRAENSNTARHLAEFWMIEPEMAFYELKDNMDLAEEFLKYLVEYTLEHCSEELEFLEKRLSDEEKMLKEEERSPLPLREKLQFVIDNPFKRLTYTEAVRILENSKPNKKKKFKFPVSWGLDLQSEHERYLVEKEFKAPVILTDYPTEIKSFYMKQNEDGKTVKAMDVLFPGIGEIIGGSEREDNYDKLLQRVNDLGIDINTIWWYLETRKYGSVPHSGFGLGFERLVLFVTGMKNIRDVIAYPRTPQSAEF